MKLIVKQKGHIGIRLWLPNKLIFSKKVLKLIGNELSKEEINVLYDCLKDFVKNNGHFVFLEVKSKSDNSYIKISM